MASIIKMAGISCIALSVAVSASARDRHDGTRTVPAYSHIVVIVEENKDFSQVMNPAIAPNIAKLASENGSAETFFGEVHPSEANYLALLGGGLPVPICRQIVGIRPWPSGLCSGRAFGSMGAGVFQCCFRPMIIKVFWDLGCCQLPNGALASGVATGSPAAGMKREFG